MAVDAGRQGAAGDIATSIAWRACVRSIRFKEVFILQGAPVMGALFGGGLTVIGASITASIRAGFFLLASVLLVAHVFLLNDWAGVSADARDPHKAGGVFRARAMSDRVAVSFSVTLLVVSLVIFATLEPRTLGPAIGVAILGAVYSHPMLNAKSRPVASSMLHLLGGELHFLLGYLLFAHVDARGIALASFFALTFAAGHQPGSARLRKRSRQRPADERGHLRAAGGIRRWLRPVRARLRFPRPAGVARRRATCRGLVPHCRRSHSRGLRRDHHGTRADVREHGEASDGLSRAVPGARRGDVWLASERGSLIRDDAPAADACP